MQLLVVLFNPLLLVIFLLIFSLLQIYSIGTDSTGDLKVYGQREQMLCPPGFGVGSADICEREPMQFPPHVNPCPPGFGVDSSGLCEQIKLEPQIGPQEETSHLQPDLSLGQSDDFTTYRNDTLGITIQHPFDWILSSDIPFFDFVFLFDESAGLGVKVVDIPSSIDLDQIYSSTYAILPYVIPQYQLISAGETSLSGYPAFGITFEGYLKEYNKDIKVQTIFTVVNDKLYGVVYFAFKPFFEDYRSAAFQRMIDSFGII
jgi:hypothetical protein